MMTDNRNAFQNMEKQYRSPEARVVMVKMLGIICVSNPDAYTTEMVEGNDNW